MKNLLHYRSDKFEEVFFALKEKDEDSLKSLFSQNTVESDPEFDEKISELVEFIKGTPVSYDKDDCTEYSHTEKDDGKYSEGYGCSYDIETTEDTYRIAFFYYSQNTFDPKEIGIISFHIIRGADDPNYPMYIYWGDGTWNPGIHFNVYYVNEEDG